MDTAPKGVILFSLGFIFDPSAVPVDRLLTLMRVFGRLEQRVVAKLDGLPKNVHVPPNVLLQSFLPQQEILAHPKMVLFFSHCGGHGLYESVWNQVPLVCMATWVDQVDKQYAAVEKGIALGLDKWATEDEIHDAIVEVISKSR